MIKKPNTLRLSCAIVVCFIGVSAFRLDVLRMPAPIDLPEITEGIDLSRTHPVNPFTEAMRNPRKLTPLPPEMIDNETLWLARAIFSETKRPEEQILVAWVIRNRVETGFRGKRTYEDVVLDPYQFSAFLSGNEGRPFYFSLDTSSDVRGWQRTLHIAYGIRHVNTAYRPFPETTRHFFSERSMAYQELPDWVEGHVPVEIGSVTEIDQRRFRFYQGIS